ncbi:MAG: polyprenol monophosphomannose synthase [Candidatus Cloacimonetes bacterium]|nr:polyprenol monophosphomannose synthase [Candidatus Cloacimonadota bacterium]
MKALVIVPTYNEAENIQRLIQEILSKDERIELLIIDDNSPDGTAALVEGLMPENSRLHLMKRESKLGLGSAYIAGFKYALERDYSYIFEMDGDFSHDPNVLPIMLQEIENNDLVIGSRYVPGGSVINWPIRRLLLSYIASQYVRVITGMQIKDTTSGFKCYRREVIQDLDLNKIMSDGYAFQVEIKYRIWLRKKRIKEIPIIFNDRINGHSKMSRKIVYEAIWMVWRLRFLALFKKL